MLNHPHPFPISNVIMSVRFTREIISWEQAFADNDNAQNCTQACSSESTWLYAMLVLATVMDLIFIGLFFRIPMLRGIVMHVIRTTFGNIIGFAMRQRNVENFELQRESGRISTSEVVIQIDDEQFQSLPCSIPNPLVLYDAATTIAVSSDQPSA